MKKVQKNIYLLYLNCFLTIKRKRWFASNVSVLILYLKFFLFFIFFNNYPWVEAISKLETNQSEPRKQYSRNIGFP